MNSKADSFPSQEMRRPSNDAPGEGYAHENEKTADSRRDDPQCKPGAIVTGQGEERNHLPQPCAQKASKQRASKATAEENASEQGAERIERVRRIPRLGHREEKRRAGPDQEREEGCGCPWGEPARTSACLDLAAR